MAREKDRPDDLEQLLSLLRQPDSWPSLNADTLASLVQLVCAGHGQSPSGETLLSIAPLYRVFADRTDAAFRIGVEQRTVVEAVLQGVTSADALVPFIVFDDAASVISSASLDLAVLQEPDEASGPFTGPLTLLAKALPESGMAEHTRAGILVGLYSSQCSSASSVSKQA
jgi:hypothetical protein